MGQLGFAVQQISNSTVQAEHDYLKICPQPFYIERCGCLQVLFLLYIAEFVTLFMLFSL